MRGKTKEPNEVFKTNNVVFMRLTQGQICLLDEDDYMRREIKDYRWCAKWDGKTKSFRAVRNDRSTGKHFTLAISRVIMNCPKGLVVDHISHDTVDNRRCNLRICSIAQNGQNRRRQRNSGSGYKGVTFHNVIKKWQARIQVDGKRISLGYYSTAKQAGEIYALASKKYHKEFACNG